MKGKKIAGLPIYVWMGVLAGGLLLGIYLRHRSASTSAPLVDSGQALSDPTAGLSGQSVGGNSNPDTSAMDPSMLSDLLNGIAAETDSLQGLTEQVAGLTNTVSANVGSSSGSGSTRTTGTSIGGSHPIIWPELGKGGGKHPKKKKPVHHRPPRHHHTRR